MDLGWLDRNFFRSNITKFFNNVHSFIGLSHRCKILLHNGLTYRYAGKGGLTDLVGRLKH